MRRTIWLERIARSRHQLSMTYGIDDLRFETAYWYNDVDLMGLEAQYGRAFMEKVYFHILAFEVNKLVSLRPEAIDLGPFAPFHTRRFEAFWRTIVHHVWAQWRYENNLPDYQGPAFTSAPTDVAVPAAAIKPGPVEPLLFCGGGKDSLVTMKLFERADLPYSSFAYSHSIYGTAARQHKLIQRLLNHGTQARRHQLWVYDSLVDAPVLALYPDYGARSLTAAETPSSLFAVLPVVLQHGYRYLALAHERSANVGNLIWSVTGEAVNHQWGKSLEAEECINDYLQTECIANIAYFSVLQPIYDVLIFSLLRQDVACVADTHSCNIQKPWCMKCPKCAYVWLNYMAYLPIECVDALFGVNLFDLDENQLWFHQMLGLGAHTPFECIGQIPEVQLAFELCKQKGLTGKGMDLYKKAFPSLDVNAIVDTYVSVDATQSRMPAALLDKIHPQMQAAASQARRYIDRIMAG